MSDHLIGPKTWDQSVEIFGVCFGQSTDSLANLCDDLCIKLCFGVYEAGNYHGFRSHKVELMFDEWATHRQPTARFWTVKKKTVPICMNWAKTSMCYLHEILLG